MTKRIIPPLIKLLLNVACWALFIFITSLAAPVKANDTSNLIMTPMVIGQDYEKAYQNLKRFGLNPQRVSQDCSPHNQVVKQWPEPGEIVKIGSTVSLITCRATTPITQVKVPDFRGLDYVQAKNLSQKLGLKLRQAKKPCLNTLMAGKISEQDPEPGILVKIFTVIRVIICSP